ncbi:MAG: hypothetical protein A3K18_24715 [Lentisphaerae bacterium RIFOXYA12_64_32]|nr:MAG: hypothetical protein A3K18_24715 [Lentisphaerae bacterium RIFOXYA12_64_32]
MAQAFRWTSRYKGRRSACKADATAEPLRRRGAAAARHASADGSNLHSLCGWRIQGDGHDVMRQLRVEIRSTFDLG